MTAFTTLTAKATLCSPEYEAALAVQRQLELEQRIAFAARVTPASYERLEWLLEATPGAIAAHHVQLLKDRHA